MGRGEGVGKGEELHPIHIPGYAKVAAFVLFRPIFMLVLLFFVATLCR